jgi:putative transposase
MALFKNKYRIEPARLKDWDYSSPGWYYVTICTRGMECYFGEIVDGKMHRNHIGECAHNCWLDIPKHFKNILLDEFINMPNHMHGIIIINNDGRDGRDVACNVSTGKPSEQPNNEICNVSIGTIIKNTVMSQKSPKPGSLPAVMRSYKSAVTNWCHKNGYPDFAWQSRYYDNIIRNDEALKNIRNYIQNNPTMWEYEKNHNEDFVNWI